MPTSTDLDFLVDQCINNEEYEYASCSVLRYAMGKVSKVAATNDIISVANALNLPNDIATISDAFDEIEENMRNLYIR